MDPTVNRDVSDQPVRKLATAQELRGKKSGSGKDGTGKKRKLGLSILGLVVVLGLALGALYLSGVLKPEGADVATEPTAAPYTDNTVKLNTRSKSEVASVTVALPDGETYTVVNNNTYDESGAKTTEDGTKGFVIEGLEDFDLNQTTADTIIGYAANLTASSLIEENAQDLSAYGLDNPRSTVTMSYKDGKSKTWIIGNQAPTSTGSYFAEKGSGAVFLIYSSAVTNLTKTRNDLHTVNMPWTIADAATITDIIVEAQGRETIELGYADPNEKSLGITTLRVLQPFVYSAHSDRSNEIFQGAAALTIDGYAGEIGELEDTGLEDGASVVKVTMTVKEDENEVQHVYRLGNFASADKRYAQIDDTNAVYLVNADTVAFLDKATPEYVVDLFANLVNITMVDQIDITTADDSWNMSIEREEVEGKTKPNDIFYFDGELQDETLSRKLYQVIIGTMNSKISDDYNWDGDVYCTVKYTLNVDPGEELIEYLEYNDEYLAVRRAGQTLFLIKRENIDNMIKALRQFREGTFVPAS